MKDYAMKLLLFSALCIFSVCVFAQFPKNPPRIFRLPDTLKNFKGNDSGEFLKQFEEYLQRKKAQNNLLADKRGNVAILPQDNMPCVVPDTKGLAPMPNAWSGVMVPYIPQYHPIPNPALPKKPSFKYNPDNGLTAPSK